MVQNGSGRSQVTGVPVRRARSVAALLDHVMRNIADGTWRPGDQVPNERELARQFGLARNTLRRGLEILEADGTITREVGRGTFVAAVPDAASAGLEAKVKRASPAEIMAVRLVLEPQAVELAATRASADDLLVLQDCLTRSEAATTIAGFEEWDGALHRRIVRAARIELLSEIYAVVEGARRTTAWGKLKERSLTAERRALYERQHRTIVTALRHRDAELARAEMKAHLLAVQASFDVA